jgi:predicted nucleic acid-binding protein
MRLFLDANVLFSAAHSPDGRARVLFTLTRLDRCDLLSSPHAIEEARRNLQLKYPDDLAELEELVSDLVVTSEANPANVAWAIAQSLPREDAPILAAAVEAKADLLVTGDRTHFGSMYGKSRRGVKVVSPAQALAQLLQ